jgi:hypothetical protein
MNPKNAKIEVLTCFFFFLENLIWYFQKKSMPNFQIFSQIFETYDKFVLRIWIENGQIGKTSLHFFEK